jgi:hypothetical protein
MVVTNENYIAEKLQADEIRGTFATFYITIFLSSCLIIKDHNLNSVIRCDIWSHPKGIVFGRKRINDDIYIDLKFGITRRFETGDL